MPRPRSLIATLLTLSGSSACAEVLGIESWNGAGGAGSATSSGQGGAGGGSVSSSSGGGCACGTTCEKILRFGDNTADDHAGTADTTLVSTAPGFNFGATSWMTITGQESVGLLRFELAELSPKTRVCEAKLLVFLRDPDHANIVFVGVREAWAEGDQYDGRGAANWLERLPGVAWTAPGCLGPASCSEPLLPPVEPLPVRIATEIALPLDLVQSWIDVPEQNHGVSLRGDTTMDTIISTKEWEDGRRPSLHIRHLLSR